MGIKGNTAHATFFWSFEMEHRKLEISPRIAVASRMSLCLPFPLLVAEGTWTTNSTFILRSWLPFATERGSANCNTHFPEEPQTLWRSFRMEMFLTPPPRLLTGLAMPLHQCLITSSGLLLTKGDLEKINCTEERKNHCERSLHSGFELDSSSKTGMHVNLSISLAEVVRSSCLGFNHS